MLDEKRWLSTVTWQTSAGVSAVNKDILAQVRTYHVLWRLLSLIPAPAGRPASLVPFEEISPHTARRWLQQLDGQEKGAVGARLDDAAVARVHSICAILGVGHEAHKVPRE